MKKQTVLWAALAVMVWVWTVAAQFTITLDENHAGASGNTAVMTDAHGSLMGDPPLPVPTRAGQIFNGWFTAATGGSRVIVGATGTKFTRDATIYARWSAPNAVQASSMAQIPPAMKENFDWLRTDRWPRERYFPIPLPGSGWYNTIFDQIWGGNGTLNWGIRWETNRDITLEQRQQIAAMLHEAVNQFTRPLIGMEGWPFQEISVKVVGYAVSNGARILDPQPNEEIWVNNTYDNPGPASPDHPTDRIASAPRARTRVNNLSSLRNNGNYQYPPGGLYNRIDLYLWCTEYDFGAAGHGSWWGTRMRDNAILTAARSGGAGSGVLLHEIGHGLGLYDFYSGVGVDRPPATTVPDGTGNRNFGSGELRTIMHGASGTTLNTYDQWQIRYYWDWAFSASPAARFPALPETPTTSVTPSVAARTAPKTSQFRFDNRGTLTYNLDGVQTATLKVFDSRGRVVKTMQLCGKQTTVNTNLNTATQMLIWKVESKGKVMEQGRMQFVSR